MDLLGAALQATTKKSKPGSASRKRRISFSPTLDTASTTTTSKTKSKTTTKATSTAKKSFKSTITKKKKIKCCFCNDYKAVVSIKKSLTSKSYCLLHYYTTKACRIDILKVHLIDDEIEDKEEFDSQLPYVQELFSEAFTELQKDISTESAKSFQSMVERGNDPLSILMDAPKRSSQKASHKRKLKSSIAGNHMNTENDGGFLRQLQTKELELMNQQTKRIQKSAMESVQKVKGIHNHGKNNINNSNLSKRRKTSSKSSWHLVLENKTKSLIDNKNTVDLTSDVATGVICSCGSKNVELCGNITSNSNAVSKADTWGYKRESDITVRYRCMNCNKSWNEEC
jgi:hypothetical protein